MKCLKDTKTGDILRVSDLEAYQKVGNRLQYVSKSEWKKTRPAISVKQVEHSSEVNEAAAVSLRTAVAYQEELTIAEKQLKKKKSK